MVLGCEKYKKLFTQMFLEYTPYSKVMNCPLCRLSMEHIVNEVREVKTNLKKMENKMKAAPEDFKQQMEEFLKVR